MTPSIPGEGCLLKANENVSFIIHMVEPPYYKHETMTVSRDKALEELELLQQAMFCWAVYI